MSTIACERWLPVVGYENYEVSDIGNVRSLDRVVPSRNRWGPYLHVVRGRLLKQSPVTGGYPAVTLCQEGRESTRRVYRLVLEAFAGPCPPGMQALHGPHGKLDSRWPENLRWGTPAENAADKLRDGTWQGAERNGQAKLRWADVIEIRRRAAAGEHHRVLAREFHMGHSAISLIVRRETWRDS
jgi:hypothetical protein